VQSLNFDLKDKENRNVLLQEEIGTLRCNYNLLTESTKSVRADSLRLKQLETGGISVEQQFKRHTEDKNLLKETILKLENRQAGLMTANQSCSEQSYKSQVRMLKSKFQQMRIKGKRLRRQKEKRGEIHGSSTMVVDQGEKDCINPCKKKSGVAETKAFYDDEFGARNIEQCKSRQMKRSETTFEFSADQFSPRPKRRRNRIFFYD